MAEVLGNAQSTRVDAQGDTFEHWVIKRSFAMLGPICRMGLFIDLAHLVIVDPIFSEFDTLVDKYDVEKIKTIGDAYMVVGKGNPMAVAELATEMLLTIKSYNALNGVNFALRIGIHVGATVAGVIGLKRFLYDVWGDAVNTASRLESTGVPGRIHVSEAIFSALGEKYAFEGRGQIEIKGKGTMHTFFLLGPHESASGNAVLAATGSTKVAVHPLGASPLVSVASGR